MERAIRRQAVSDREDLAIGGIVVWLLVDFEQLEGRLDAMESFESVHQAELCTLGSAGAIERFAFKKAAGTPSEL